MSWNNSYKTQPGVTQSRIKIGSKVSTVEYGSMLVLGHDGPCFTVRFPNSNDFTMRIHAAEIINLW